ncbi:MAG TPA: hypothetical protein PLY87_31015, partial [Planctomycetaceae bacterium]|nr:hypothetical protein [Planctomycetaceae bacterium]
EQIAPSARTGPAEAMERVINANAGNIRFNMEIHPVRPSDVSPVIMGRLGGADHAEWGVLSRIRSRRKYRASLPLNG